MFGLAPEYVIQSAVSDSKAYLGYDGNSSEGNRVIVKDRPTVWTLSWIDDPEDIPGYENRFWWEILTDREPEAHVRNGLGLRQRPIHSARTSSWTLPEGTPETGKQCVTANSIMDTATDVPAR